MGRSRRQLLALLGGSLAVALPGCGDLRTGDDLDPGAVEVIVGAEDGPVLFDGEDVTDVGPLEEVHGAYEFTVTVDESGIERAATALQDGDSGEDAALMVSIVVEGDVVTTLAFSPGLRRELAEGTWDGRFRFSFDDEDQARDVHDALAEGS